jgi:CRP-like cAMP-binding protein
MLATCHADFTPSGHPVTGLSRWSGYGEIDASRGWCADTSVRPIVVAGPSDPSAVAVNHIGPGAMQPNILMQVDVFQDFPEAGLAHLAAHGQWRTFRVGETLLSQGEISDTLYVIVRGRVRTERAHPALNEPATIHELGPGDSVGEFGVLDRMPRPETAIAVEETEALELSALLLAETMLQYPMPSVGLLSGLSRSVRTLAELETCVAQLRDRSNRTKPTEAQTRDH